MDAQGLESFRALDLAYQFDRGSLGFIINNVLAEKADEAYKKEIVEETSRTLNLDRRVPMIVLETIDVKSQSQRHNLRVRLSGLISQLTPAVNSKHNEVRLQRDELEKAQREAEEKERERQAQLRARKRSKRRPRRSLNLNRRNEIGKRRRTRSAAKRKLMPPLDVKRGIFFNGYSGLDPSINACQ